MWDVIFRDKSTILCSVTGFSEELFLAEVLPLTFAYLGISTWLWTGWHSMQALVTYYVRAKMACPFSRTHCRFPVPMHKLPRACKFLLQLDEDNWHLVNTIPFTKWFSVSFFVLLKQTNKSRQKKNLSSEKNLNRTCGQMKRGEKIISCKVQFNG